jgi:hypothetical protein
MFLYFSFLIWLIGLGILSHVNGTETDFDTDYKSKLCINNGHVLGQWVENSNTKKTFYVCSWDAYDYKNNPLCGDHMYDKDTLFQGSKEFNAQTGGHGAVCDVRDNTRHVISKREQYTWEPMLCYLIPWNATLFCSVLGNRKVFLIGDSRMLQIGASLMSRLRNDLLPQDNCAEQIYSVRSNKFQQNVAQVVEYLKVLQPEIIISNTGAHFANAGHFVTDLAYLSTIRRESNLTQSTWVWATNNPGHVNCSRTSGGPLLSTHYTEVNDPNDEYHWQELPRMDSLAKEQAVTLGMRVIDMSPLYYRQDAHSDCLHFCLPGPLDLFSVLLMNMLYNNEL